jgi:hypothetical protein
MKKGIAAGFIGLGLLALAGTVNALTFSEAAGSSFEQVLSVTPNVDNELVFQVTGSSTQFESLSFSFAEAGPSVVAEPSSAAPAVLVATFNDLRDDEFLLNRGMHYLVTVSGRTRAGIPGGEATVAVNVLNGDVTMPAATAFITPPPGTAPESYAMLLFGLIAMGAKIARRRIKGDK